MANLEKICKKIRLAILKTSYETQACHIGSALSCVEILVSLYWKILKRGDIFIFGKASGASALYCVLAERGVIKKSKLNYYLKNFPLASTEVPGIFHGVGSLGHGLPVSVGIALADKKKRVFCLMGDSELDEGTTWESALFASQHHLDNLVVIVDRNRLQATGRTEDILGLEPLLEKFKAFGWTYCELNGHDSVALNGRLKQLDDIKGYPIVIVADTIKGRGVDFMEDVFEWHYWNLNKEQYEKAILQISK